MSTDKKNSTGVENSGNWNSGGRNSGGCNSGDWNSGGCNSGSWNSGSRNSGGCNSGSWNSGSRNSGDWNSGGCNSGSWNSGNRNSGYLNTNKPKIRIFNKETDVKQINFPEFFYFHLTFWISEEEMTDEEKRANTDYKICGGYLKTLDYKDAWKQSWDKAYKEDREKLFKLPNFDAELFKEISGIDVTKDDDLERKKKELIDKANELLEQAKNL